LNRKHQSIVAQIPRRHNLPLPPSPLGLSNYDALDLEDELQHEENDGGSTVYSDFNFLNPVDVGVDEYDYLDELDGLPPELPQNYRPLTPPDEKFIEIQREKERQKEFAFLRLS
jgi:hypothetical protein